ncbi:MAG: protein-glutamine gamma-glutamyltransferase TgpA [Deferrisomatales bacterium]
MAGRAAVRGPRAVPLRALGVVYGALALAVAPHAGRVPWWVLPVLAAAALWRGAGALRGREAPVHRAVLLGAGLAVLAAVAATAGGIHREAFLALLIALTALKVLEVRGPRDLFVLAVLAGFLCVTHFFYDRSIPGALRTFGAGGLVVLVFAETAEGAQRSGLRAQARLCGALALQAAPLFLVLFVLFPRLSGPLWGLRLEPSQGVTGLAESLYPGSVSRVVLSDDVAFRVSFVGETPPPERWYWRGPVFDRTDGRRWWAAPEGDEPADGAALRRLRSGGRAVRYSVTLEPHGKHWLLALDVPMSAPPPGAVTSGFYLRASRPVVRRLRYRAESRLGEGIPAALARPEFYLQLPEVSPRVRALGEALADAGPDPVGIAAAALEHFRAEPFAYTLSPPPLGPDPVDGFLFETRRGFCEHYAAAFATLMRVAGVPARVVTGYQGGELNPVGGYVVVRQASAHAWAEVWAADRGWVRVDPVAAVAPERVERVPDPAAAAGDRVRFVVPARGWASGVARRLGQLWDAANHGWNQWVLDYGPERQARLLSRIGLGGAGWKGQGAALVAAALGLLAALGLWTAQSRWRREDPAAAAYGRFCRRLERIGLGRAPHEGPLAFAGRVGRARPDLAEAVGAVAALYAQHRYAPPEEDPRRVRRRVGELRARVRRFRPRRRPLTPPAPAARPARAPGPAAGPGRSRPDAGGRPPGTPGGSAALRRGPGDPPEPPGAGGLPPRSAAQVPRRTTRSDPSRRR